MHLDDVLVYEERDPTFSVSIDLSKSRKFILLDIDEERTTEFRYLPADQPAGEFKIMEPRRHGVRYQVDHVGDRFFIHTNLDAPDFRLMSAPEATPDAAHWRALVPETAGTLSQPFRGVRNHSSPSDFEDERGTTIHVFALSDHREIAMPRPAEIGVASSSFADDNEANLDPRRRSCAFASAARCIRNASTTSIWRPGS